MLEETKAFKKIKSSRNVQTYDFSTLCTKIPSEDLNKKLKITVEMHSKEEAVLWMAYFKIVKFVMAYPTSFLFVYSFIYLFMFFFVTFICLLSLFLKDDSRVTVSWGIGECPSITLDISPCCGGRPGQADAVGFITGNPDTGGKIWCSSAHSQLPKMSVSDWHGTITRWNF